MQFQKNPSGQQWNAGNNNGYGGDEGQWGNNYDGYTEDANENQDPTMPGNEYGDNSMKPRRNFNRNYDNENGGFNGGEQRSSFKMIDVKADENFNPRREIEPEEEGSFRLDTLYLYGVDYMNEKEVLNYFNGYNPIQVEWINDSSCNVIFQTKEDVARVLNTLAIEKAEGDTSHWREGVPVFNDGVQRKLEFRYATPLDIKENNTNGKQSQYYQYARAKNRKDFRGRGRGRGGFKRFGGDGEQEEGQIEEEGGDEGDWEDETTGPGRRPYRGGGGFGGRGRGGFGGRGGGRGGFGGGFGGRGRGGFGGGRGGRGGFGGGRGGGRGGFGGGFGGRGRGGFGGGRGGGRGGFGGGFGGRGRGGYNGGGRDFNDGDGIQRHAIKKPGGFGGRGGFGGGRGGFGGGRRDFDGPKFDNFSNGEGQGNGGGWNNNFGNNNRGFQGNNYGDNDNDGGYNNGGGFM